MHTNAGLKVGEKAVECSLVVMVQQYLIRLAQVFYFALLGSGHLLCLGQLASGGAHISMPVIPAQSALLRQQLYRRSMPGGPHISMPVSPAQSQITEAAIMTALNGCWTLVH